MSKTFKAVLCAVVCAIAVLAAIPVLGSFDLQAISAPSSPATGYLRLFADSSTGRLACKDSGGADCMPPGGRAADIIPSSPNAMDDEFNDSTVDAKWTQTQSPGAGQSITEANGFVTLVGGTQQNRWLGLTQPISGSSWKVRCKVAQEGAAWNYFGYGLTVARTTGGLKHVSGILMWHSTYGTPGMYIGRSTAWTTLAGGEVDVFNFSQSEIYFEIEYDGTNLIWRTSTTGGSFRQVYTETAANYLGGAPELVGIITHMWNNDTSLNNSMTASFDWFRRIS